MINKKSIRSSYRLCINNIWIIEVYDEWIFDFITFSFFFDRIEFVEQDLPNLLLQILPMKFKIY
jgi:hypothetical protein